ncbi:MAG: SIMPL domain-containing protein [Armatimonadota bacterium]|nr:SIMPL domain-containing protein [Armatimonadota bacterium]
MNKFLFTLLLLLWPGAVSPVQAQTVRPEPATFAFPEGLTAHGHYETKAKPDIAYLTVGVTTQASAEADATQANATRTAAVMSALKKAGIADKDIQTQYYSVEPQYDYKPSPPVRTGYQVENSVQVTIRDLTRAGIVVDQATQAGANQVSGLTFDLADRTKAEAGTLAMAVAVAHLKAAVMAQAAGVELGRLVNLSEGAPSVVQPVFLGGPRMMAATAAEPTTPISPREITITADATIVYAIGPAKP